jgi:hypothetical protein
MGTGDGTPGQGAPRFIVVDTGTAVVNEFATDEDDSSWHCVCMIAEAGSAPKIRLDGTNDTSATGTLGGGWTLPSTYSGNEWTMFRENDGCTGGVSSETRIAYFSAWDKAISDAECDEYCGCPDYGVDNRVFAVHNNGNAGNAVDVGPNGIDGTEVGTVGIDADGPPMAMCGAAGGS